MTALEIPHVRSACSVFVSVSVGAVTLSTRADTSGLRGMALVQAQLQAAVLAGGNRGQFSNRIKDLSETVSAEERLSVLESDA